MSTQHTATPYYVETLGETLRITALCEHDENGILGPGDDILLVGDCHSQRNHTNAAFVVRACNNFDDLLAALQHTLAALDDAQRLHPQWIYTDAQSTARAAILKATQP
jgi:hypothetical protein